jgi:hypothetical protein
MTVRLAAEQLYAWQELRVVAGSLRPDPPRARIDARYSFGVHADGRLNALVKLKDLRRLWSLIATRVRELSPWENRRIRGRTVRAGLRRCSRSSPAAAAAGHAARDPAGVVRPPSRVHR